MSPKRGLEASQHIAFRPLHGDLQWRFGSCLAVANSGEVVPTNAQPDTSAEGLQQQNCLNGPQEQGSSTKVEAPSRRFLSDGRLIFRTEVSLSICEPSHHHQLLIHWWGLL